MAPHSIFTIGHSTRPLAELVALLKASGVKRLVDVRAIPRSRTNPQYNIDTLPAALAAEGIDYAHRASLGGRRGKSKDVPPDTNALWENASFHNYADYALSPAFAAALEELRQMAREHPVAIMCSEAVWWRCHRRIIADHLLAAGEDVRHILAPGKVEKAKLTPGAQVGATVTYPFALTGEGREG